MVNVLFSTLNQVVDHETCDGRLSYNGMIKHGMLCIGELQYGGKDACNLDSGGPAKIRVKIGER